MDEVPERRAAQLGKVEVWKRTVLFVGMRQDDEGHTDDLGLPLRVPMMISEGL